MTAISTKHFRRARIGAAFLAVVGMAWASLAPAQQVPDYAALMAAPDRDVRRRFPAAFNGGRTDGSGPPARPPLKAAGNRRLTSAFGT